MSCRVGIAHQQLVVERLAVWGTKSVKFVLVALGGQGLGIHRQKISKVYLCLL
ncbi:MAG: hypothetical protein GDA44_01125 [Prochloron sp. SP5CPC1]|nr:hypothetical protein [Candidatus Paraprochloron terpiosi SP5CPC1]